MINFDNAATTFPKPLSVRNSIANAITNYGGNPGRSGHSLSMKTAEAVFKVRNSIADFFNAKTENVIFTLNCTHALNMAIKGIMQNGGHIITSSIEHNAVSRPIYALSKKKIKFSIAEVFEDDDKTIESFERLIIPQTKAIACTIASNVTGQILPYQRIAELCKKHNICFIADGAQACGIFPIKLTDGINILCLPGHKGLYGPTGTGLLITDGKFELSTIIEGGTGATSDELEQTAFLPEMLESGTINTAGIIALGSGLDFVKSLSLLTIYEHEKRLCDKFISEMTKLNGVTIYRMQNAKYAPIVAFNINGFTATVLAKKLDNAGFALRGGFHCAAVTHRALGTIETGALRFSPSYFNNERQVQLLIYEIKKILKK